MPIFAAWFHAWPETAGSPVRPDRIPYRSVNATVPAPTAGHPLTSAPATAASTSHTQLRLIVSVLLSGARRAPCKGRLQDVELLEQPLHLLLLGRGQAGAALPRGPDRDALEGGGVLHELHALAALQEDRERHHAEPELARLADPPLLHQVEELDALLRDHRRGAAAPPRRPQDERRECRVLHAVEDREPVADQRDRLLHGDDARALLDVLDVAAGGQVGLGLRAGGHRAPDRVVQHDRDPDGPRHRAEV